jgi:hypothetical protein
MFPLALLVIPVIWYFFKKKSSNTVQSLVRNDLPPPNQSTLANVDTVPAKPTIAGAFIWTPDWYKPKDDLNISAIIGAKRLTIRQWQYVFNYLGANLTINGTWDMPTTQAAWDYQYIHQADNPYNLLNLTGEIDVLTQSSIQAILANKVMSDLANNPDIHVPGSEAWKQYNAARDQNPWA